MKLTVNKEQIIEGLLKAAAIIPAKAGAQYLRSIWLKAEEGSLSVMEKFIKDDPALNEFLLTRVSEDVTVVASNGKEFRGKELISLMRFALCRLSRYLRCAGKLPSGGSLARPSPRRSLR